jgi:pyruvate/2-oxoglutarate dehydrogenase complex dihydrolipoamide acyltransferase (E2) component
MNLPIQLPDLGLQDCRVSLWLVEVGEFVYEGDRILEILSGPALFDVAAPANGRLVRRECVTDDFVTPNMVLGWLEPSEESA